METQQQGATARERLARIEEQIASLKLSVDRLYKILGWFGATVGVVLITALMQLVLHGGGAVALSGGGN